MTAADVRKLMEKHRPAFMAAEAKQHIRAYRKEYRKILRAIRRAAQTQQSSIFFESILYPEPRAMLRSKLAADGFELNTNVESRWLSVSW